MNSTATLKVSELMRNIIVYVEVRTEEDNRSEGIKKVISSLGAKVNNRLTRKTTHVVFKDGLLSTYKKAKQLNIPLVSILWIEACKENFKIMDPSLFPISNIDRYEFPEMYDKIKRIKNMQPDAIDKKTRLNSIKHVQRNNLKQMESPHTAKLRLPRIPRTPKDNLNNILTEFQDKIMSTPDNDESLVFKSKLLQKIQSSPFTPSKIKEHSKGFGKTNKNVTENVSSDNAEDSLKSSNSDNENSYAKKPKINFVNKISKGKQSYRRKTISSTPNQNNIAGSKNLSYYFTPTTSKVFLPTGNKTIESSKDQNCNDISNAILSKSNNQVFKDNNEIDNSSIVHNEKTSRRTLYTPQNMEISKFHSARRITNNRRRTLFDISLDLIDKGLKNINEQLKTNKTIAEECTINDQTNIKNVDDSLKISSTPTNDPENTPIVKKRKLFMPDQVELTPLTELSKSLLSSKKRTRDCELLLDQKKSNKKRRTTVNGLIIPTFNKENRRSSFDFDKFPKKQITLTPQTDRTKIKNILVCTNMHKEQLEFVEKVVKSLGNFEVETQVTEKTTHVVSLECRRTINIIKGIIRGLWILKYEWVVDSFNKGKWLHEETYELREFSRTVEICRSERQAFGPTYRMELFADLASIYVSNKCKVPVDSLKDVVKLCSGHLVKDPKQCKYVIGDYFEGKICLEPQWILDCITNNKIVKFFKYTIKPEN
ncbi:microcephalin [Condylostylus longicornis]|uniref:microcephalin n=1 Tax=Condylostylus longicornis TaxID=2530218 RepID=UPI00244DD0BF|nr:microcephalin [Condylostylus longicornis]